jgi:hypothetical protein
MVGLQQENSNVSEEWCTWLGSKQYIMTVKMGSKLTFEYRKGQNVEPSEADTNMNIVNEW